MIGCVERCRSRPRPFIAYWLLGRLVYEPFLQRKPGDGFWHGLPSWSLGVASHGGKAYRSVLGNLL
jgi:hypothetical protein